MRCLVPASLLLIGATSLGAEPALPSFGALRFGDDLASIRAAFPTADWHDRDVSKITGRVLGLDAKGVIDVGGQEFDAIVEPGYYGEYRLELSREFDADANACEGEYAALLGKFESSFGPFDATPELLSRERISDDLPPPPGSRFLGSGYNIWSLEWHAEAMQKAGEHSGYVTGDSIASHGVKRVKRPAQPEMRLMRAHARLAGSAKPIDIIMGGNFWSAHKARCVISIRLLRNAEVPPPEPMPFDAKLLRHAGSVARRFRDLESLPAIPTGGVRYIFECEIPRRGGSTFALKCQATVPNDGSPFYATAQRWASAAKFDFANTAVDRDDPRLLLIAIPIEVGPLDGVKLDFLDAPALDSNDIPFARGPRGSANDYYPPRAMRLNLSGTVELACKVQRDFSILCGPHANVVQPDADLVAAGLKLAEQYEVAPTFPDGKSTVGHVFIRRIDFKLGAG